MLWWYKKMTMRIVGVICLLLQAPTPIFAGVWVPDFDNTFFEELRVTGKTKILQVTFTPTASQAEELNKQSAEDRYFTRKVEAYNTIGGRSLGTCTLGGKINGSYELPMILDCGIRILGLGEYEAYWGYWFMLKQQRGDWYEVIADPKNGTSKWFKLSKNEWSYVEVETIGEWLRESALVLRTIGTHIEIEILEEPKEGARPVARWEVRTDKLIEHGFMRGSTVQGDWIKIDLITPTCFSKLDPVLECGYDPEEKRPPCAQGWVRWRSSDGRLLLYPKYVYGRGC
jgi:hypothetical protein